MKQSGVALLLIVMCIPLYSMRKSIPLRKCFGKGLFQCSIEEQVRQRQIMWRAVLMAADDSPQHLREVLEEYNLTINEDEQEINEKGINKHGQGARFLCEAVRDGNDVRARNLLTISGLELPTANTMLSCLKNRLESEKNDPKGLAAQAITNAFLQLANPSVGENNAENGESQGDDLD